MVEVQRTPEPCGKVSIQTKTRYNERRYFHISFGPMGADLLPRAKVHLND